MLFGNLLALFMVFRKIDPRRPSLSGRALCIPVRLAWGSFFLIQTVGASIGQDLSTPFETSPPPPVSGTRLAMSWAGPAAAEALQEGLPGVAANLLLEALPQPDFPPEARPAALLDLTTALLASNRLETARQWIAQAPDPSAPAWRLRRTLLHLQAGQIQEADESFTGLTEDLLSPPDRPWFWVAQSLFSESRGAWLEAGLELAKARELTNAEGQRTWFDLLQRRRQLLAGQSDEADLAELRRIMRDLAGQRGGFEAARLLAVALAKVGRTTEAIDVLRGQLGYLSLEEDDLHGQFLLLLGFLAGEDSAEGRASLQELLQRPAARELHDEAFQLLAAPALEGRRAPEFLSFLTGLLNAPQRHPLEESILLTASRLATNLESFDEADGYAQRLLAQYPGSRLRRQTLRQLAFLAWRRQPPQWRTAADYLAQLRVDAANSVERGRLGLLMGDCYFLNGDYTNAVTACAAAFDELPDNERGDALFQRVQAGIKAGRLEETAAFLDEKSTVPGIAALDRWRAEWNLATAWKLGGRLEIVRSRLSRLLAQSEAGPGGPPPELRLRLLWLEAQLSVETRQVAETANLTQAVLRALETLPPEALDTEQRRQIASRTLLLQGEALFISDRADEGLRQFNSLRQDYADSEAAALTYLIEARHYASRNRPVDAQQRLLALADTYPASPHAPTALWEAALQAERRGLASAWQEAIAILERLPRDYPTHPLVFYARLKQGDLTRQLNDFDAALLIYEDLLNRFPDHPQRYRSEMNQADCHLAESSQNPNRLAEALAIYERLSDLPTLPGEVRAEAGYKWGYTLLRQGSFARAEEILALTVTRTITSAGFLNENQGRYWLSRCLLELGDRCERDRRFEEARRAFSRIRALGLPGQRLAEDRLRRLDTPATTTIEAKP